MDLLASEAKPSADTIPTQPLDKTPETLIDEVGGSPDIKALGTQQEDSVRSEASPIIEEDGIWDNIGSDIEALETQQRGHIRSTQPIHVESIVLHPDKEVDIIGALETQRKGRFRPRSPASDKAKGRWDPRSSSGDFMVPVDEYDGSFRYSDSERRQRILVSDVPRRVEANSEWAERGSLAKKETPQVVSSERRSRVRRDRSSDVELLEYRLAQLEERMRKMEQEKEPEPPLEVHRQENPREKPEPQIIGRRGPAIAEIRYVNWADFKNRYSPDEERYAVEVLMAGPNLKDDIRQEQMIRKSGFETNNMPKIRDTHAGKAQVSSQANEQWAHRIRINSLPILGLLAKVSGNSFTDALQTFLRPFFFLRSFHSNMKEELKKLESRWGQTVSESPSDEVKNKDALKWAEMSLNPAAKSQISPVRDTNFDESIAVDVPFSVTENQELSEQGQPIAHDDTGDEGSLTDRMEALRDLRCYVKFMDADIIPLERQFEGTSRRKIRYDDLAYLFSPEDEVYAPVAFEVSASGYYEAPLVSRYQTLWRLYAINTPEFQNSDLGDDSHSGNPDEKEPGQVEAKAWEPTMSNHFAVWCYYIDFDGKSFGAVRHVHRIRSFEGERDITSLPCYPFRFVENHRDYRRKLRELGEKYQECLSLKNLAYTGSTLICNPTGDRMDDVEGKPLRHPSHVNSDIIVDFEETFQNHPNWRCTFHVPTPGEETTVSNWDEFVVNRWVSRERKYFILGQNETVHTRDYKRLRNEIIKKDTFLVGYKEKGQQSLAGDDLILLPRRLFAYVLRERKFAQVDVGYIRSAMGQIDGFNNLQLPSGHKDMVQALVDIHFKKRNVENLVYGDKLDFDIVQGKGRGLIILLHGVPGVGKTSTAECVAATNKKPLFSITCGDLGFSPAEVESSLSEIFRLAHLWDCVLLLDEADVFLAQRTKQDLNRNALVSVFLRILEYYNGILFLTTNRVGSFDEAFKSRIHMSLYYPPLERDQTIAIWDMNIDRAQKIDAQEVKVTKQLAMIIDRNKLKRFAGRHYDATQQGSGRWNGRQIRNAFQIATALAHYTAAKVNKERADIYRNSDPEDRLPMVAPVLKVELFKRVADATLHFDKYMTETAGFTDTRLAFEQGDRADHHYFHLAPNTGVRSLGKPGSVYNSPGVEGYDPSSYSKQARNTGSAHYHGEEDQEGSNYGQAQKTRMPQAYAYPPEDMVARGSDYNSGNLPHQKNYQPDAINQGKAHSPGMFGTPTGRRTDNQYNTSSQRRPTPLSASSAQGQHETPTRGTTGGITNTRDNSVGQHSRPYSASQDSDSSE